jgi:hypothetical protein
MSNSKDYKVSVDELKKEVKLLKDATHVSLIELEKNIEFNQQIVIQFDVRLKQLENSIKIIQNTFQKNSKNGKNGKNIEYPCDN